MTPRQLRLLADCIEQGEIPQDDRRSWANDLRGHAKSVDRSVMLDGERPEVAPPAQEHPDTARLNDVIRRATAPMQGVTFYRKITTGKWQYQERDDEGYMGICGEGETQRDAIDNAARKPSAPTPEVPEAS